jgi:tetratricopeptide (TPR) repeat protein
METRDQRPETRDEGRCCFDRRPGIRFFPFLAVRPGLRAVCSLISRLLSLVRFAILYPLFSILLFSAGCTPPPKPAPPPMDYDLSAFNTTARLEFDRGEITDAAASYQRALNRARAMDDAKAIAETAYNLAICESDLGNYDQALPLLEEAQREAVRAGQSVADIQLVKARIALLKNDPAQATDLANAVLYQKVPPTDAQSLQAHIIKGLTACQRDDASDAAQQLSSARTIAARIPGPISGSLVSGLSAQTHLQTRDFLAAATDFDQQAQFDSQSHNYRGMERALAKAGRAYRDAGKLAEAADRLYRAARAASGWGSTDATALAKEAADAASVCGDAALIQLTTALLSESTAATRPAE